MGDLYRKVGKRYKKAGHDFEGFPANGIWIVKDGCHSLICQVSDLVDPVNFAGLCQYQNEAAVKLGKYVEKVQEQTTEKYTVEGKTFTKYTYPSTHDIVRQVILGIAEAYEEDPKHLEEARKVGIYIRKKFEEI